MRRAPASAVVVVEMADFRRRHGRDGGGCSGHRRRATTRNRQRLLGLRLRRFVASGCRESHERKRQTRNKQTRFHRLFGPQPNICDVAYWDGGGH